MTDTEKAEEFFRRQAEIGDSALCAELGPSEDAYIAQKREHKRTLTSDWVTDVHGRPLNEL